MFVSPVGDVVDSFDARGCDATIAETKDVDLIAPQFGQNDEIFALDATGAVVRLSLTLEQPLPSP